AAIHPALTERVGRSLAASGDEGGGAECDAEKIPRARHDQASSRFLLRRNAARTPVRARAKKAPAPDEDEVEPCATEQPASLSPPNCGPRALPPIPPRSPGVVASVPSRTFSSFSPPASG